MTLSPAFRPSSTSHLSPTVRLTLTGRTSTLLSLPTTIAVVSPFGSRAMPCIGTSTASLRTPPPITARTYMPGISRPSGLSTFTRRPKLPVVGSTLTSENSSVPLCSKVLPSSIRMLTGRVWLSCRRPAASSRRSCSSSAEDWVRST